MTVDWYCKECDENLPLGLWDKIPYEVCPIKSKKELLCPNCKNNTFYCLMDHREVKK